jgi:hypothetical protein
MQAVPFRQRPGGMLHLRVLGLREPGRFETASGPEEEAPVR